MPRHLLNVGRLVPEKAQHLVLQAVAELVDRGRDVTATIVGDGPEAEGLRRLRHALGLDRRVALPGALGQPDLPEQFASADAFLMPSFDEGVPVVLMEAMACGLPVVATRIAGVPELIDDGVSGLLVTPGRVDELANAVERLFGDADLRAALAKAGRAAVEERFDTATEALALGAHFRAPSRSERR
jgi:glycosyltransferase involved in cell wall biosynthesis